MESPANHPQHPSVTFFIDQERCESATSSLSVRQILQDYAKEDPSTTTLAEKRGDQPFKFTNLDEVLDVKNGTHFVVFHNSPTPVS